MMEKEESRITAADGNEDTLIMNAKKDQVAGSAWHETKVWRGNRRLRKICDGGGEKAVLIGARP